LLHVYSAILGTQNALHYGSARISSTTSNMQHPHDAKAAINHHHTPAYWWRRESDDLNQYMRMIRRPWWTEASG